ncbi:hypothetical protein [Streptomyces sp. NPDC002676]
MQPVAACGHLDPAPGRSVDHALRPRRHLAVVETVIEVEADDVVAG